MRGMTARLTSAPSCNQGNAIQPQELTVPDTSHPASQQPRTPIPGRLRNMVENYPEWRDAIQGDLDAVAQLTQLPIPKRVIKALAEHHPERLRMLQGDLNHVASETRSLEASAQSNTLDPSITTTGA